jgi:hypothetical protein
MVKAAALCRRCNFLHTVTVLFAKGPHQVIFDVLKYHSIYRRVNWEESTSHDIGIVTDWVNSSSSLLLVLAKAAQASSSSRRVRVTLGDGGVSSLLFWLILQSARRISLLSDLPAVLRIPDPLSHNIGSRRIYAMAARFDNSGRPQRPVLVLLCVTTLC